MSSITPSGIMIFFNNDRAVQASFTNVPIHDANEPVISNQEKDMRVVKRLRF